MRQSVGVCRQVCSVVSAGSDACYVRTPYDDKSTKEIAGLLVRVQSEELYQRKHFDRDLVDLRCPGELPDNDAKRCSAMRLIYSCCASQAVEAESGASRSPAPPSPPIGPLDHPGSTRSSSTKCSASIVQSPRRQRVGSAVSACRTEWSERVHGIGGVHPLRLEGRRRRTSLIACWAWGLNFPDAAPAQCRRVRVDAV